MNNAGVALEARTPALCHLTDESTWDTTMRVNAKSVFLGCKYALAQMLQQDPHPSGDRGWIINMSSILGLVAGPDNRKHAVLLDCWFHRANHALSFLLRLEGSCEPLDEASCNGLRTAPYPCECHLSRL